MAVRWRIGAAFIDNLIVYCGYVGVCLLLHWRVRSVSHLFWLAVAGVAYHFLFEVRDGQTLGKRHYGIRVVAADGGPARPRAIAIRSLLRLLDSFPVCYVSGLISMVRTGRSRRQRIGDIAAGTVVVAVDGRAARHGTPRWMLPVATVIAVAASALTVVGIAEAGHQPLNSEQAAEFVSGCQNSQSGAFTDCRCLLGRLDADGYNTVDALKNLESDAAAEEASGTVGPARVALRNAALACRP
jgi:uncharacterized RDD family membrane protein YckC